MRHDGGRYFTEMGKPPYEVGGMPVVRKHWMSVNLLNDLPQIDLKADSVG
jgi:hypothetical protein